MLGSVVGLKQKGPLCPVDLLWDRGPIHRRREVQAFVTGHPRLHVHHFPTYAPELNPAKYVWAQADQALANGAPDDLADLRQRWTPPSAAFGALSTSSGPASTPRTLRARDEAFHHLRSLKNQLHAHRRTELGSVEPNDAAPGRTAERQAAASGPKARDGSGRTGQLLLPLSRAG